MTTPTGDFTALQLHMIINEAAIEAGLSNADADRIAEAAATRFAGEQHINDTGRSAGRAEAARRFGSAGQPDTNSTAEKTNDRAENGRAFGRAEAARRFGSTR